MVKLKVMVAFSTKAEALKLLPVVSEMKKYPEDFLSVVITASSPKEELKQIMDYFSVVPKYELLIEDDETRMQNVSTVLSKFAPILIKEQPDVLLINGETTTTMAMSLAAFYHKIRVGHVGAGLRTWQKYMPFPEEINRQVTDVLTDFYFVSTDMNRYNLLLENHEDSAIFITGNTAAALAEQQSPTDFHHPIVENIKIKGKKILLFTMDEKENLGKPMERTFKGIRQIAEQYSELLEVIFPLPLDSFAQERAKYYFATIDNVHLFTPLEVKFHYYLMANAYIIITDSGTIQEVAPTLGVPVLVLRDITERPEGIKLGASKLIGTSTADVRRELQFLLDHPFEYQKMAEVLNPYGDKRGAERIINILKRKI
ncbi:non-hydrolyzing UDP-N-acetylglucosamine 2-epimerase [Enterococcus sp. AZ192]|uniref:non-hydrolyzing UDP-N-acetylglucosamine 2-epimerase n=1 Tax=unclassified Enterococcus TaxID=2608891 RepID=UPI003D268597